MAICSDKPRVDGIDAVALAPFAEMMRPEPRPPPDAASRDLSALVTRYHQLMTAESNRRDRAPKTHIDQRAPASAQRAACYG
jgi:transposase